MGTEILEEILPAASALSVEKKSVFDVLDADIFCSKNDPDHVEPEGITGSLETGNPDLRRSAQLALLPPVHCSDRSTERIAGARLHFHERNRAMRICLTTTRDEIDVAMAVSKTMLDDIPAVDAQPSRRHSFAFDAHRLPRIRHGAQGTRRFCVANIESHHTTAENGAQPTSLRFDTYQRRMRSLRDFPLFFLGDKIRN